MPGSNATGSTEPARASAVGHMRCGAGTVGAAPQSAATLQAVRARVGAVDAVGESGFLSVEWIDSGAAAVELYTTVGGSDKGHTGGTQTQRRRLRKGNSTTRHEGATSTALAAARHPSGPGVDALSLFSVRHSPTFAHHCSQANTQARMPAGLGLARRFTMEQGHARRLVSEDKGRVPA